MSRLAYPRGGAEPAQVPPYEAHRFDYQLFDADWALAHQKRNALRARLSVDDLIWQLLMALNLLVERPGNERKERGNDEHP